MRYLLAPDSFKEAASAVQVAQAMERGVRSVDRNAEIRRMPLSDGGEGLTQVLVDLTHGEFVTSPAHDALGRPIEAQFGFLGLAGPRTAVVELAAASGLERIRPAERNPMSASTYGTGELMCAAIDVGAEHLIIGLGGSATTDGGTGLARALGYRFLDADGRELEPGGGPLTRLDHIDGTGVDPRLATLSITLATDVTNPLTGPTGAARMFAPQKGATPDEVELLDRGLERFADAIGRFNGRDVRQSRGAGAAGGSGAGLLGLFDAVTIPGIELVLELSGARQACQWADLVITGEGSIDAQTPHGKVPAGIARLAKSNGVPAVAIAGKVTRDADVLEALREIGITAVFGITPGAADLATLLADTQRNVEATCASIAALATAGTLNRR